MREPVSSNAGCEPAEKVAKGHGISVPQGSGIVSDPVAPKTTRKTLNQGKTQARGGKEVLATARTSDPTGLDDTRSQSTTSKTGDSDLEEQRSLPSQSEQYYQLELWDSA
jgi:hypothetical protein